MGGKIVIVGFDDSHNNQGGRRGAVGMGFDNSHDNQGGARGDFIGTSGNNNNVVVNTENIVKVDFSGVENVRSYVETEIAARLVFSDTKSQTTLILYEEYPYSTDPVVALTDLMENMASIVQSKWDQQEHLSAKEILNQVAVTVV